MGIHKDETNTSTMSQEEQHNKSNVQPTTKEVQLNQAASPPPSSTSSPSHEFSFTISLPPPPASSGNDKTKSPHFASNIDLSPADEIFFHGHLLPLHFLSHHTPNISARSSTNSLDSFITFTLKDELLHNDIIIHGDDVMHDDDHRENNIGHEDSEARKVRASRLRSLSHLFLKWIKHHHHHHEHDHDGDDSVYSHYHHDDHDHGHDQDHHHHKHRIWRPRFNIVKRYMRLVKPFIHIPFVRHKRAAAAGNGGPHELFLRQPASFNSYTGSLRVRKSSKDSLVIRADRRSEFSSAPVSIKTSPTNSGLLVASGNLTPTVAFKNDSTVDELQAGIQAAIAHCKNSTNLEVEGDHGQKQDKFAM